MANWWESGQRFRVVVQRQVTEEETVSLEALAASYEEANQVAKDFTTTAHDLMIAYNQRVHEQQVQVYRQQLDALETQIGKKVAELRQVSGEPVVEEEE